jgi:predicted RNA methylase
LSDSAIYSNPEQEKVEKATKLLKEWLTNPPQGEEGYDKHIDIYIVEELCEIFGVNP